jgi:hypothetical protein
MMSNRAEAMTLGATAAGVRVAVQDVGSVAKIGYDRPYIVPNYWWWGPKPWRPQSYLIRKDIRFGAYCWRQNVGYGVWVRPCPARDGFYP